MFKKFASPAILLIVVFNGLFLLIQLGIISQSVTDGTFIRTADGTNAWSERSYEVSVIDNTQQSLADGDLILAIESQPVTSVVNGLFCITEGCRETQSPEIHNGATLTYTIERDGEVIDVPVTFRPYPFWRVIRQSVGGIVFASVSYLIFLLLLIRQPNEPAIQAMALMSSGFFVSLRWSFGITSADLFNPTSFWSYQVATQVCYILGGAGFLHFVLVFPKPSPIISRFRWPVGVIYLLIYTFYGAAFFAYTRTTPNQLLWLAHLNTISSWFDTFVALSAVVAIIIGYLSLKNERERQKVQIIVFSIVLVMAYSLILQLILLITDIDRLPSIEILSFMALLIPLTIVFSIQRHRLWNIDPLVNRALVYASLSLVVIFIYIVMVAITNTALNIETNSIGGLIATGFIAIIFQPLRERLQKIVNRVMYGKRDDPADVLNQLAHHLETANTSESVLPNLVQTIAQTLRIPYVAIWLPTDTDRMEVVTEWGKAPEQREMISLIYQNQTIGHLVVAPRGVNERFNESERSLLMTIAALTATTVRAVQLSNELRQSRQRIITAREEERRRIRRDLHDGLGPQLASQTLSLEAIAQQIPTNPQKAQSLLESLQTQAHEAIQDVRRLVYDLRPPALDDLGLVGALEQSASRYETSQLQFSFEVPRTRMELPAAIETAVYRITQEAMTNVVRHANARRCIVRLYCDDSALFVEIEDDGCGLPEEPHAGVGLQTMSERAAELNGQTILNALPAGGTLIKTWLPLEDSP